MLLYHFSPIENERSILEKGILPPSIGGQPLHNTGWNGPAGNPDAVYLTINVYPMDVMARVIVQIDSDRLRQKLLAPAECWVSVEYMYKFQKEITPEATIKRARRLHSRWRQSIERPLNNIAECAYYGVIEPDAFTGLARVPARNFFPEYANAERPVEKLFNRFKV